MQSFINLGKCLLQFTKLLQHGNIHNLFYVLGKKHKPNFNFLACFKAEILKLELHIHFTKLPKRDSIYKLCFKKC